MTSFSEEMRRRGLRPGSKTLSLDIKHAGAYLGRCLHVSPSERIVVAKRLRLADDESMAIETLHVPERLVPGLTREDFDQTSFYDLLTDRYGIEIVGGIQTIEPTVTNEEESEILERAAALARVPVRAHDAVRDGHDRRVRAVDLPRRPLPARDRAEPARALRRGARLPAPRAGVVTAAAAAPQRAAPGAVLLTEIREQPAALRRLLEHSRRVRRRRRRGDETGRRADPLRRPRLLGQCRLVRRLRLRPPARLDGAAGLDLAVGLLRRPARARGSSVVALSQSGQTPDVLEYVERARARGAFTSRSRTMPDSGARATQPRRCCRSRRGPSWRSRRRRRTRRQVAALALLAGTCRRAGR